MKRPTLYEHMAKGTFIRPVKLAPKLAVWPKDEVAQINAARVRGATDDQIRALVIELTEARKNCV
ncbi:phage-related protein [Roseovarius sp. 217]|nr:phage-related protein [Roseovarius sp. 217]